VFSADQIGIALANEDPSVRSRITRAFGREAYGENGELDRPFLAAKVFRSPVMLARLNKIIHPAVLRTIQRSVSLLPKKQKLPYVVIESALIYEAGLQSSFDYIVLVDAPVALRVVRSTSSSRFSKAEVRRRSKNQIPARIKRPLADFVVVNRGSLRSLERNARFLDETLSRMALSSSKRP